MLRNYLIVAWRNLLRHKVYSLINIGGLAVGMACFFLIMGYVRCELTYDRYHQDADRIYRIIRQVQSEPGGDTETRVNTAPVLRSLIREGLPGIEEAARLGESGGIVSVGERRFVEGRFFFADPEFLGIFTLPLEQGDARTALREPFSVLLTPEMGRKYCGTAPPLGQVLRFEGRDFKVTGVLRKLPPNTHFHPNFLASFASQEILEGPQFSQHWDTRVWTYVKLGQEFGVGQAVELFWRQQENIIRGYDAQVVGVLKDFNHRPYMQPQPMVFAIASSDWSRQHALLRIRPDRLPETVGFIEGTWKRLFPDLPSRSSFLDQDIEAAYRSEKQMQRTIAYFAGLAIAVACLGLFGLASYTAEQRTKEVGIRKVLGASVPSIVALLSKEFTYLVLAANLLAWPVASFAMRGWLGSFAYRIEVGPGVFVLGGLLALGIAWLTVSWQAVRAALANPVEALRYE